MNNQPLSQFDASQEGAAGNARLFLVASLGLLALSVLASTACAGEFEQSATTRSKRTTESQPAETTGDPPEKGTAEDTRSLPGTLLAFQSLASTWEVVVASPAGDVEWLTNGSGFDGSPVWSPEGRTIAFVRAPAGDCFHRPCEIFAMDADGGDQRNLTRDPGNDQSPVWSPDGKQIAFERDSAIYVMNADGSGQRKLTSPHAETHESNPAWSPDGTRIAFAGSIGGGPNSEIYIVNADGSGLRTLTGRDDDEPEWSPDGRRIAFTSTRTGKVGVYVMNPDGTSQRRQSPPGRFSDAHAWSPVGSSLVFESRAADNTDIYIVKSNGTGLRRLTDDPAYEAFPAWSSDGQQIAFTRDEQMYVMNADGSDPRPLESHSYRSAVPAFQPSP